MPKAKSMNSIPKTSKYQEAAAQTFNDFYNLFEDSFIDFFGKDAQVIIGFEYSDHPNYYSDIVKGRLGMKGLTDIGYYSIKLSNDLSLTGFDVKGKRVLLIDIHAAPEQIIKKYMKLVKDAGATDVMYAAPSPKPLLYHFQDLPEEKS